MPLKSFEEELNNKTRDFAMIPKSNLWESIEPHLVKEKGNNRAIWIWLPVGVAAILFGAILLKYYTPKTATDNARLLPPITLQEYANVNAKNEIIIEKSNSERRKIDVKSADQKELSKNYLLAPQKIISDKTMYKIEKSTELTNNVDTKTGNKFVNDVVLEPLLDTFENVSLEVEVIEKNDTLKSKISQIDTIVPVKKTRTFVGLVMLPNLAFTRVGFTGSDANANMAYQQRKVNDKSAWNPGFSWQLGMEKGKHQFTAGIAYQTLSYRLYVENITREIIISNSSTVGAKAFVATDSFASAYKSTGGFYTKNSYRYLSIPFGYQFNMVNKSKWSLGIAMGIQANFMISSKALLYNESTGLFVKQTASQENHLNKINLLWSTGFQLNYSLAPKCNLFFKPTYAASVLPVENANMKTWHQLYQFGFGVNWYLH